MALFLVEHQFDPPVDTLALGGDTGTSPCLKTHDITWVSSFLARDGTQCVCLYEAPDAEAVRRAYRTADVPFRRVWSATQYKPA